MFNRAIRWQLKMPKSSAPITIPCIESFPRRHNVLRKRAPRETLPSRRRRSLFHAHRSPAHRTNRSPIQMLKSTAV
jgi:hypothetical protein